jgi:hypothetical protein
MKILIGLFLGVAIAAALTSFHGLMLLALVSAVAVIVTFGILDRRHRAWLADPANAKTPAITVDAMGKHDCQCFADRF